MSESNELTREQMLDILRQRIWRAHKMTPEAYFEAKRCGTLQRKPSDAGIEVFSGEYARQLATEGRD